MTTHVCGIDIGKTVFHLIGLSKEGQIVIKRRFTRKQLITHTVNMPACLIGMEACPGAHFLARVLMAQGHKVKLMPAEYVRPFVKSNKNDYVDAEAIGRCAAAGARPPRARSGRSMWVDAAGRDQRRLRRDARGQFCPFRRSRHGR